VIDCTYRASDDVSGRTATVGGPYRGRVRDHRRLFIHGAMRAVGLSRRSGRATSRR